MFKRLFERGECNNHHYGDWDTMDEYRTGKKQYIWEEDSESVSWMRDWDYTSVMEEEEVVRVIAILRKNKRTCQHENCHESQESWRDYRIIPLDEMQDVGYGTDEIREEMKE